MTKDFFSDGVLVYDRYYCSKPVTPLLVIKRMLLAAVFCGCSFGYIVTELNFPVSALFMAGIAAALCCVFSAVYTFEETHLHSGYHCRRRDYRLV